MRALSIAAVVACLLAALPFNTYAGDEPVSIRAEFRDSDAKMVIAFIAEQAAANVIVSPKVAGQVTLRFKDVPWRAALEQVAATVGAKVVEERGGILRVVPSGGAPRGASADEWIRLGQERRERDRADIAALERLRAEIEAERERLERAREEANAKRVDLTERAAALRSLYEGLESKDAVVQLHDVRDLIEKHPQLPARVQVVAPHASVELKKGVIILRAAPEAQRRVRLMLTELRKAAAAKGPDGKGKARRVTVRAGEAPPVLVVGQEGKTRPTVLVGRTDEDGRTVYEFVDAETGRKYRVEDGKVVALDGDGKPVQDPKEAPSRYVVTKDGRYEVVVQKDREGRYVARTKSKKPFTVKVEQKCEPIVKESIGIAGVVGTAKGFRGGKAREARAAVERFKFDEAALKAFKRAQDLETAAKHLEAAGDETAARDLYRRAKEAYEQAKRRTATRTAEGSLLDAVSALRRDVNQLRGEVRELTGLVRRLLGERAPAAGRAR